MGAVFALIAALGLVLFVYIGVGLIGLKSLFAVVIPYAAFFVFLGGMIYRIVEWAKVPVPFRIVTTCGQQKSLKWVKRSRLESPYNNFEVLLRMALEVFAFRSLFRNLKAELKGPNLLYGSNKWLWLGAIAFHYCFFVILIRHFRFFSYPVPYWLSILDQQIDAFLHIGIPHFYLTDGIIVAALTYLLLRRLADPKLRYISLASDFMPLFLIFGLVLSGILMRYFIKVDIVQVKEFTLGLVHFSPKVPDVGVIFYIHLFFLCALMAYFPFSKLVHMAGVFFSPTRNLANNSRAKRHEPAPWWKKPKFKTYCEWQEEFKEVLEQSGQPIDEDCYKNKEKQAESK
ncbi:sulfate reduction electron transfer complex DsrMKJOP subunit DsrM [Thermodesulfatator atlanticus]|uniref:sulfate reduction electron transfer complex DsrMKJOP subunit DsrM n=1 Tax=Thermodesulfatator atlanticus TaxID=501497 RepID=UPI0003B683C4|nr:sulfate reduction electron transfer complex DsrMKJOP subunit DsrM [Thermodesulfatator atlanticus]